MNITPKDGPAINQPPSAQASARDRAIQALLGNNSNQAQATPVANPTSISAEESSAIPSTSADSARQTSSTEGSTESQPSVSKAESKDSSGEDNSQMDSHYANLARKERALRAKVQQAEAATKAKEAELAAREEALKAKEAEYQSKYIPKDRITSDGIQVLLDMGLSVEQINQMLIQQQTQDPQTSARMRQMQEKFDQELQRLREEQDKTRKLYEDNQKQQYDQALNQIRIEARTIVANDPAFETVKATNSIDDVVDLIEKTFNEDGVLMSVEEAAQAVEEYLVEEAMKLAKLSKIQKRLQPAPQQAAQKTPEATSAPKQTSPAMKTLTNSVGATRQLTARERAILAMKGELK